jgi:hypothetical protein
MYIGGLVVMETNLHATWIIAIGRTCLELQ